MTAAQSSMKKTKGMIFMYVEYSQTPKQFFEPKEIILSSWLADFYFYFCMMQIFK